MTAVEIIRLMLPYVRNNYGCTTIRGSKIIDVREDEDGEVVLVRSPNIHPDDCIGCKKQKEVDAVRKLVMEFLETNKESYLEK